MKVEISSCKSSKPQPCKSAVQDGDGKWWIEVETVQDLFDLAKEVGEDIIVNQCDTLSVYDTYIE
jgi:hypothetical protein